MHPLNVWPHSSHGGSWSTSQGGPCCGRACSPAFPRFGAQVSTSHWGQERQLAWRSTTQEGQRSQRRKANCAAVLSHGSYPKCKPLLYFTKCLIINITIHDLPYVLYKQSPPHICISFGWRNMRNLTVPQEEGKGGKGGKWRNGPFVFYGLVHGRSTSTVRFKQTWLKQPFLIHF